MIGVWVDYAGGRPGGAALARAGITGAIRYAGIGTSGKRITAAEYADLKANSIRVMLVAESTTTEDDNGYAAGVSDARAAEADRVAFGMPADTVIFAVNDKTTYVPADLDYVRGFRDALGVGRTGAYGFGSFVAVVHQFGTASVFWQAGPAPSRTGTTGIAQIWQRNGGPAAASDGPASPVTESINGVTCDLDNQLSEVFVVTTLDDTKQSLVPGSTVVLPLWQYILNADMYGYEARSALAAIQSQLSTIQGALAADEAALLAAIKAVPALQVDAAAVATALDAAGLPQQLVAAFVAVLNKATGGTSS